MPNAVFVVFSSPSDPNHLFRHVFAPDWDTRFGTPDDLVWHVPSADQWDVAMVWEPDGDVYSSNHKQKIKERLAYLKVALPRVQWVGVILHETTPSAMHQTQRELIQELLGHFRPHEVIYAHKTGNLIYQAVAAVLQQKNADTSAYQEALRKLFALVCSPYDLAIDILMAFLPADLEWQITTGQNANAYLPQPGETQAKYDRFKQLTGELGATSESFKETNTHFEQIFQQLPENPQAFHKTYEALRDALLAIVEAVEHGGERNPA
jgi:hypothetical protein